VKIQIVSFICVCVQEKQRYGQRVPIVSYYVGYGSPVSKT